MKAYYFLSHWRKWLLAGFVVCVTALSGCLPSETPCDYFKVYQKEMYNNTWNIDSLHIFVFNPTTQYARDTTYSNYGSLKFVSSYPYSCTDNGKVLITTTGNSLIQMDYSTGIYSSYSYTPYTLNDSCFVSQVCIKSSVPLDGYPAPYYLCSMDSISRTHMKIFGDQNTGRVSDSVPRYWEFFLSIK